MTREPDPVTPRVGFIGLGVMGTPMAGHLARAGYRVTAYDIDRQRVDGVVSRYDTIRPADAPSAVARDSDIVITMLPSGAYVRDVALGEHGLVEGFSGGELLIDTSSSEPGITLETAARLNERGIAMVDAPTSGAESGAEAAALIFMLGGEREPVGRAEALLRVMGRRVFHLGPIGSGHMMKSINNLITAITFLATGEGLALGTKLGLDPNVMTDVLNEATGMSWITQTHIKQRITNRAFDDPFKLALMVKDIRIALELAAEQGIELPLSALGQRIWQSAETAADPAASVSELIRWVEARTGVTIAPAD